MFAYLMAQTSAIMSASEGVSTKSVLNKFSTNEHVFYKNLVIFFLALVMGFLNWHITVFGVIYVVYMVVINYFNEHFRSKAMQSLEINTFALLASSSIFIIYGIEVLIGREELIAKNVIGIFLFTGAIFLFLDVKISDFFKINKAAILCVVGHIVIVALDRPIAKTVLDNGWISPESAVLAKVFILIFVFYYFGKRQGMVFKGEMKKGIKAHLKIGFLKYGREILYVYALLFGSVLIVTLALSTALFLTFIFSGFYFKESRWTLMKGVSIALAVFSIILISV